MLFEVHPTPSVHAFCKNLHETFTATKLFYTKILLSQSCFTPSALVWGNAMYINN